MTSVRSTSRASLGLGVAVTADGDCKLAVRYPWRDESRAPHLDELTEMAHGEVDVEWTGPIRSSAASAAPNLRGSCRPLKIGSSVAYAGGTAGTLCGFVRRGDGAPELLSCNHVIADCDRAAPNAAILQPGPSDGGKAADLVGRLAYAHPLGENAVDCAVATVETGVTADLSSLAGFGDLTGLVAPSWYSDPTTVGQRVAKVGRTTGITHGRVTVLSFSSNVTYPIGTRTLTGMIELAGYDEVFAMRGDSGAMVFTGPDLLAAGMLIAVADNGKSYMTRLDTVLSSLGAVLAI
jgi:hypothetical protein